MDALKFQLGQVVKISASGESGTVRARAEYLLSQPSYYVHYQAADGRAVEAWWPEDVLEAA